MYLPIGHKMLFVNNDYKIIWEIEYLNLCMIDKFSKIIADINMSSVETHDKLQWYQ